MNIVLMNPEIPQNTGNIARTCAAAGMSLHIIKPMGFTITDKHLKRAGLDYWHLLDITYYEDLEDFCKKNSGDFYYCSTKAKKLYHEVRFNPEKNIFLFFGKETKGLPEDLIYENFDRAIKIPMIQGARSLNLANSVAIVAYEVVRQFGGV